MKEEVLALARGVTEPGVALNRLREYLQAFVIRSFHDSLLESTTTDESP